MKFTELDLDKKLLKGIQDLGFDEGTPIQEKSFQTLVDGLDVAGLAQTGTGKTAAFFIPLIERFLRSFEDPNHKRAFKDFKKNQFGLVLVPTRELAEQVYQNFVSLAKHTDFKASVVYGGTSYEGQKKSIREGVQFIVATPGRLIDLYKEHIVDLAQVNAIIFDEADRMFDMGFKDDMKYILQRVPKTRQFVVFSATLDFEVLNTAYEFGSDPVEINVSEDGSKADNVKDEIFHVGDTEKPKYLLSLLKKYKPKQVIVFSNFKRNVERLGPFLTKNGYHAEGISSLLTQAQRTVIMKKFKSDSDLNILVATDVAARGLDIKNVDMVINYELSDDAANYVHRIGRTGRAGEKGTAFSLVCDKDVDSLARIEDYLGHKIEMAWLESEDFVEDFSPMGREGYSKKISENYQSRKTSKTAYKGKKPASGGRPDRKPRPPRRDEKETSEGTSKSGEHRDRRTGRHKAKGKKEDAQKTTTKSSSSTQSKTPRKSKSSDKKKYNNRRRRSSGGGKSSSAPMSASSNGVSGKVSSFLKKIFS